MIISYSRGARSKVPTGGQHRIPANIRGLTLAKYLMLSRRTCRY